MIRARYEYAEEGAPALSSFIDEFLKGHPRRHRAG
jgi:hypothetical protein